MPVLLRHPLRRLSQAEFGEMSFEVMGHVFAIHNEIGRFFDERIYKQELAYRMPGVRLEEPVDVSFGSFQKRFWIDAIVGDGGIFEFKSADRLSGRHRAQLLQYLILCDIGHGKLINLRPEDVEHEYVNSQWRHADRVAFDVEFARWNSNLPGASHMTDCLLSLLRDLGTGLSIPLYEEAITSCLGLLPMERDVAVVINGREVGHQHFRLLGPDVAFKITAFDEPPPRFEVHARRLLAHVGLRAISWVNIAMKQVTLTTLE